MPRRSRGGRRVVPKAEREGETEDLAVKRPRVTTPDDISSADINSLHASLRSSSSSSSHLPPAAPLLSAPDAVLSHSILPFFHLLQLLELRQLCKRLQPFCEQQAVVWMNATFTGGLQTLRVRSEEKLRRRRRRKQPTACEQQPTCTAASSPPPLTPSSTSSLSCPSPPSVAAYSYSLADALWVKRQCWLWSESEVDDWETPPAALSTGCKRHYAGMLYGVQSDPRQRSSSDLVSLLDWLLSMHGHASDFLAWTRWSAGIDWHIGMDWLRDRVRLKTQRGLYLALRAANFRELKWQERWSSERMEYRYAPGGLRLWWDRRAGWRAELEHEEPSKARQRKANASLHAVMLQLGMSCAGRCGWGQCGG